MKKEHNEQVQLPSGYRQLEYIESDGNQYIEIDWSIGRSISAMRIETDAYPVQPTITYGGFIGTNTSSTVEIYYTRNNNGRFAFFTNPSPTIYVDGKTYGKWYHVECTIANGQKKMKIDESESSGVVYGQMGGVPSKLYVFKYASVEKFQGRLKRTSISITTENGTIKAVLVPALRNSDNKPGLYDLCGSICPLTGTPFYVNAGTGEFLYQ